MVGRGRDVLEHPREVAPSVEERLDGRADRRREGLGKVRAPDPLARDELGRADRRVLGADRARVERVGRDAACTATPEGGTGRGDRCPDHDRSPTAHRSGPLPEMTWNVNWPPVPTRWGRDDRVRNGGTRNCNALGRAWAWLRGYPFIQARPRRQGGVRCLNSPSRRAACRNSISPRSAATTSCGPCPRIRMPEVDLSKVDLSGHRQGRGRCRRCREHRSSLAVALAVRRRGPDPRRRGHRGDPVQRDDPGQDRRWFRGPARAGVDDALDRRRPPRLRSGRSRRVRCGPDGADRRHVAVQRET